MPTIDDIQNEVDDHEQRLEVIENNGYADTNLQDLQDAISQLQDQLSTDEQNLGQLSFPLSQDTIDLISEQAPSIFAYLSNNGYIGTATLVAGTVTVTNTLITASSLVMLSVSTKGGTQGDLSYTTTAGSLVISSSSATDTSTVIYFILQP